MLKLLHKYNECCVVYSDKYQALPLNSMTMQVMLSVPIPLEARMSVAMIFSNKSSMQPEIFDPVGRLLRASRICSIPSSDETQSQIPSQAMRRN